MTVNLYSIKDRFSGFMNPMMYVNDDVAKREFGMAVASTRQLNYAPGDFDLYRIGSIDNHSGRIDQNGPFEFICNGSEVVENENKDS